MARKEITEKYNKYKVFYLVKITKSTNLTYVVDRIRDGIQRCALRRGCDATCTAADR